MTKLEVQQRVQLPDGTNISLDDFMWDEKTNTFSSELSNLILNFTNISYCTFDTGSSCTFKTGDNCTFDTGSSCTLETGSSCTFKAGHSCTFDTGYNCTFKTDCNCTFETGSSCTFKAGHSCTFETGSSCTFKTGYNCTFDTGSSCTFETGSSCTFKTGSDSVIVRRDIFLVIQPKVGEEIKLCPCGIGGYLSRLKGDKYFTKDGIPHDIFDGVLCKIVNQKGSVYKVIVHGEEHESYVVQQGDLYAHGNTITECKESLIYKISNRDTSEYKSLTIDSVVSYEHAVKMYRAITGACESQTKSFAEQNRKDKYSVKDLIDITCGQYNSHLFQAFFEKNN